MEQPQRSFPRTGPEDNSDGLEFVLVGAGAILRYCAAEVTRRGHRLLAVFTDDPATSRLVAADFGVRVESVDALCTRRADATCDVILSVGNLTKLPSAVLAGARTAAVNYHDGPLPRYPGLNAPSWALINGESAHGMTWHLMTGSVDSGGVLEQRRFAVGDDDTSFTLGARCYEAAIESFATLLDRLERGRLEADTLELDNHTRHLASDRPKLFGFLDWSDSTDALVNLGRALDFGPYANPLGVPKFLVGGTVFVVRRIERTDAAASAVPGRVYGVEPDAWRVGCRDGVVSLSQFFTIDGVRLHATDLARETSTEPGRILPIPAASQHDDWEALARRIAPHERFWTGRLQSSTGPVLPEALGGIGQDGTAQRRVSSLEGFSGTRTGTSGSAHAGTPYIAALAAVFTRQAGLERKHWDIAYRDEVVAAAAAGNEHVLAAYVPLRINGNVDTLSALAAQVDGEIEQVRQHQTFPIDLLLRLPLTVRAAAQASTWQTLAVDQCASLATHTQNPRACLTLIVTKDGLFWEGNEAFLASPELHRMEAQLVSFLREAETDSDAPIVNEVRATGSNQTVCLTTASECVHTGIERVAREHPEREAVHAQDGSLTYADLERRSNQLARYLVRRGLRREDRVAICLDRSLDMAVAVLSVLKAGGCYVPIDPTYPPERTAFMVQDSHASFILANDATRDAVPRSDVPIVSMSLDAIEREECGSVADSAALDSLAYLIYTSGSSGQPKGVMLEHRNVGSFFNAMDEWLDAESGGTWLAVTSLSFDISVLELLWTLSRGFTVVVGEVIGHASATRRRSPAAQVDFSLFYFSGDAAASADGRYRLLLEGARFADRNGFSAVWTPERHFHAFGGLYPNPAVTAAAVAAVTERIAVRAGSVVMPLHHPVRVAEEWAVVDNISGGRVGISFASGWQPNDFVLRPENFVDSKSKMLDGIETVRALWRGESRVFPGPDDRQVTVRTLPRPVQPELPVWLTAAGNPDTFRIAGERGFHVLTHLLGQSVGDLAGKIALYRSAWKTAGHPGDGYVTLMLHTFIAEDEDLARETVRGPLKDYLRTSVSLIKDFASTFPALKKRPDGRVPDFASLSEGELDALLDYSFERYYESNGLLGTPAKCRETVQRLATSGVNEIACLIDFGVDTDSTLAGLSLLNSLREEFASTRSPQDGSFEGDSVARLIERYSVTHMQCTPSLARVLLADDSSRQALGALRRMLVGGEALPVPLGRELVALVGGQVLNMYGPTETTIWSTIHQVTGRENRTIPIGRPLKNTVTFVVDERGTLAAPGTAGELLIGGEGVARGYLARPDLTGERFVEDTLSGIPASRLYRTGDRAVLAPDGSLEFLGRVDHQIKIRGHRVELGEIEALLSRHPGVRECAVTANQTADGDTVIVGHVIPASAPLDVREVRAYLRRTLPDVMIPSRFTMLDSLPYTPNGKIDRLAIARQDASRPSAASDRAAAIPPLPELEARITEVWQEVLGLDFVSLDDNFFELGGHSLSAVHVHSKLKELTTRSLAITDLFRFPTIRTLSTFMRGDTGDHSGARSGHARAEARKQALARRRAVNA